MTAPVPDRRAAAAAAPGAERRGSAVPGPGREVALVDLLDRVLAGGVVISGEVVLGIADVDLVRISLRALVASVSACQADAAVDRAAGRPSAAATTSTAATAATAHTPDPGERR